MLCFQRSSETGARTRVTTRLFPPPTATPRNLKLIKLSLHKAPGCSSDVLERKNTISDLKHSFKLRVFKKPGIWGLLADTVFLPVPGTLLPKDTGHPGTPTPASILPQLSGRGGLFPRLSGCQSNASRSGEPRRCLGWRSGR